MSQTLHSRRDRSEPVAPDTAAPLSAHRARLLGLAYRMLGSLADAEDVLQDAWLRWHAVERSSVDDAEAYLVRIVTRLCLDRLRSAAAQRELYVGSWLPEPVADTQALSPENATELAEDLSFALLLALERLTGAERAAFLLHDVFDYRFDQVAAVLDRSAQACRQLASRARRAVRERHRPNGTPKRHRELLEAFVTATSSGELEALQALLVEDATAVSDGGPKALAARNVIRGRDRVARLILGVTGKHAVAGRAVHAEKARINGTLALRISIDGALDSVVLLETDGSRIKTIFIVRNPDKLTRLAHGSTEQRGVLDNGPVFR